MNTENFRRRILARDQLVGTFLRTPAPEILEILARTGLDFICLDGEHAPFDPARTDACLAVARALDFPAMVRVASDDASLISQALDGGAVGIVVPHVASVQMARRISRVARYGPGGRGFNGGTRGAGYRSLGFAEILARAEQQTVVLAQIEEPEGVAAASEIAEVAGIDGLFVGPADLSIALGKTDMNSPELAAAFETVGAAARSAGKSFVTYVPDVEKAVQWQDYEINMFVAASDQDWIASGARATAEGIKQLTE